MLCLCEWSRDVIVNAMTPSVDRELNDYVKVKAIKLVRKPRAVGATREAVVTRQQKWNDRGCAKGLP